MGWLFSNWTRQELIHQLTQPEDDTDVRRETIAHCLRGNVLWSVVRITAKPASALRLAPGQSTTFIACHLLERAGASWGYKSLDESMAPYYYSCPLSYLDMAPEQCATWRACVRAHHARRRATTLA